MAEPSCERIEAFAHQLTDVGITYDYQPSASPLELAEWSDVVVGGTVLAEVTTAQTDSGLSFIGYRVLPDTVIKGADLLVADTPVTIYVQINPAYISADDLEAGVPVGAPVVVFASRFESVEGFVASIEGFATECPDGPLMGALGFFPGWQGLASLADLLAASREPP